MIAKSKMTILLLRSFICGAALFVNAAFGAVKFPSGTEQISEIVEIKNFSPERAREFTIPIKPIPGNVVPVVVCIEDGEKGSFSPVAVKSFDGKKRTLTFVTSHGGKYVAVYIRDFFP